MTAQAVIFTPQARQAQAVFREALECLARPGRIGTIGEAPFPVAKARHAYALLLALADQEVSIAVHGCDEPTARFASLGTGSRLSDLDRAGYVLFLEDPGEELTRLRRGGLKNPEDGASAVIVVESLAEGAPYRLNGPGILGARTIRISGLSEESIAARDAACVAYPLGIDIFLVDAEGRLAGIPRTTSITLEVD